MKVISLHKAKEVRVMASIKKTSHQSSLANWLKLEKINILSCGCVLPPSGNPQENKLYCTCFGLQTILIKKWWVHGMMQPTSKLKQVHRVSMTTLWVATTKHYHSEKTAKTHNTTHFHTMKKGGSVGRENSMRIASQQENAKRHDKLKALQ